MVRRSARHQCRTLSGALFSPPDPKLAPGTAASGKNPIRKTRIHFKSPIEFILRSPPRLILDCSRNYALQPDLSLGEEARQAPMVFGGQVWIFEQFSAMRNDPLFAFDQEAANRIVYSADGPTRGEWRFCRLQFQHGTKTISRCNADRVSQPALRTNRI